MIFRPMLRYRSARRRGFTLTEIAIVLGVISLILAAIWVAAGQVNEKARISQAANEVTTIAQNMTSLLQGGYGVNVKPCGVGVAAPCDITTAMITAGIIPQAIQTSATTASNPWGNPGLYMRWDADNPRSYQIAFYNITQDGCIGLVAQIINCTPGRPGCPVGVNSGGISPALGYAAPTLGYSTFAPPMSSTDIQGLCGGTPGSNIYPGPPNSVEFVFTQ